MKTRTTRWFRVAGYGSLGLAWCAVACSAGGSNSTKEAPAVAPEQEEETPGSSENPSATDLPGELPPDFVDPNMSGELPPPGLVYEQPACADGVTTTISGTVYAPSGTLPLYNAMVYVPRVELSPFKPGVSCSCEVSGEPIVATITDSSGHFVLENAPVAEDVPLVIQIGKWRRKLQLGAVSPCAETVVPDGTLRLPRKQSEGDMPAIAVSTGSNDALECLVRKLGVDLSEFTNPTDGGRVHLYAGAGGAAFYDTSLHGAAEPQALFTSQGLWYDFASLSQYDVVLLSCEGDPQVYDLLPNKSPQALQAMFDYANAGGRVFASHYQNVWFRHGPEPFPQIADFTRNPGRLTGDDPASVVSNFPKGKAMAEWLATVGGLTTRGDLEIAEAQHSVDSENPEYAQRWIETSGDEPSVQYISANTPLGASDDEQCGRVVLSDIHVSGAIENGQYDRSLPEVPFPRGCVTTQLSPQEKALAFMLFDLSACVVPDTEAPTFPSIR